MPLYYIFFSFLFFYYNSLSKTLISSFIPFIKIFNFNAFRTKDGHNQGSLTVLKHRKPFISDPTAFLKLALRIGRGADVAHFDSLAHFLSASVTPEEDRLKPF